MKTITMTDIKSTTCLGETPTSYSEDIKDHQPETMVNLVTKKRKRLDTGKKTILLAKKYDVLPSDQDEWYEEDGVPSSDQTDCYEEDGVSSSDQTDCYEEDGVSSSDQTSGYEEDGFVTHLKTIETIVRGTQPHIEVSPANIIEGKRTRKATVSVNIWEDAEVEDDFSDDTYREVALDDISDTDNRERKGDEEDGEEWEGDEEDGEEWEGDEDGEEFEEELENIQMTARDEEEEQRE